MSRFRSSELLIAVYFLYVALIAPFFTPLYWREWIWAIAVFAALWALRFIPSDVRDWMPLAFTLSAYREMDRFSAAVHDHHFENIWVLWDRRLFDQGHLRAGIEGFGALVPGFLEACYLLVYGASAVGLAILIFNGCRAQVNRFWLAYLAGTLGCYALFPYFPSDPPRVLFPSADLPNIVTVVRRLNLSIVGGYGIHSSVFPSAHVASTFSAAWALIVLLPRARRWIGWVMAAYGLSVAIATVYGRYHYAADAAAGIAMSALGYLALKLTARKAS